MKGKDVILGLLSERPQTGYDLTEALQTQLSHFFESSTGMVYPALKGLQKDEMVTVEEQVQHGKPNKKIYHITKKGEEYLQNVIHEDVSPDIYKSDFLVHLFFDFLLEDNEIDKILTDKINALNEKVADLKKRRQNWDYGMTPGQKYSFDIGISIYEGQLKAIREIQKDRKK